MPRTSARHPSPVPAVSTMRSSILRKTVRHTVSLLLLAVVLSVTTAFIIARSLLAQRFLAQLAVAVTAKEDLVEHLLQRDRNLAVMAARRLSEDERAGDALDRELLEMRREGVSVLGMAVLSATGTVLASAGTGIVLPAALPQATILEPVVGPSGWRGHMVISPLPSGGGYVALRYDATNALRHVLDASVIGVTGEVLLARSVDGTLELLHHRENEGSGIPLHMGNLEQYRESGDPIALAVSGEEGVHRTVDYRGAEVFAAYRYVPSLGWGMVLKVDTREALRGATLLGGLLLGIGGAVLVLGILLATAFSRELTGPLRRLAEKIRHLRPGHWSFARSVHTGDEVEQLDRVIADMARRLEDAYSYLEEEIAARTRSLQEQAVKDRTILETIEQGILVVDRHGVITDVNPAATALLGLPRERLRGSAAQDVLRVMRHRTPLDGAQHPVTVALQSGQHFHSTPDMRLCVVRKDASLLPVLFIVSPLMRARQLLGAVVVLHDITQERQLDYLKSEFTSLASHQLRTPLSALQWYLELLSTEDPDHLTASQKAYVEEMRQASDRMVNLVDALLHASRLEDATITPKYQSVDLRDLVEQTVEDMRLLAKERKIASTLQLPSHAIHITTDPVLLSIVFQNLLSNAVKYSRPGGQITIALRTSNGRYHVTVADHGIGIPKKDQKQLFQKLFRAGNVRMLNTDGTGLGLYISKMIMERLGGAIRIRSTEGKGTTVTVVVPPTAALWSDPHEKRRP